MTRTSATVSNNMRKIHSKDTSIELLLRKALWHKGYRYRKNYKALPGSPDIVLTKYKIAIFCDSEFFHFWGQDISKHTDECLQAIEEAIWDTKFSDTATDYDISEE